MNDEKMSIPTPAAEEKPGYWAVIPAAVRYDPKITAGAKLLYAEISALTDRRGYCYASNAYFQRLYAVSEPTVQRYLRALREGGYIAIADGDGGSGRRKIYAGVNPLKNDGVERNPLKNEGVTPSKLTPNPLKNEGDIKKENKETDHPPKPPKGAASVPAWKPERFAGLWTYYPRHTSKQAAAKAWDRLKPSDELIADIGRALRRQKAWDEWQRGIGIPHLATYLNQRRWEDELEDPHRAAIPEEADRREELPWI